MPVCDVHLVAFSFFVAKHNIFDSELYQKSGQAIDWLHYIEEKAKGLLNVNDYTALMKQIKDVSFFSYHSIFRNFRIFYTFLKFF